jgi:hypothetical protein
MVTSASLRPSGATSRTRVGAWRLDIVLALIGLSVGVLSLLYPFGHDQGVHYYVGREWLLDGAIPYRDTFDYKTPGIFVIHALLIALFGQHVWAIRLAELACVPVLGLLCAKLLVRDARAPGVAGFTILATCIVYYGYFPFWDSAQCELWAATFAVASIVVARQSTRYAFWVGVLAALAFLMKPPAVLLAAPAFVTLVRASRRSSIVAAAGFVLPIAVTLVYFAAHHALGAMFEVLFGADPHYVIGSARIHAPNELYEGLVDVIAWFHPFGALLVGSVVVFGAKAIAERQRLELPRDAVILAVLALVAIASQLKFYRYHFGLLVPALVLAIGHVQERFLARRPGVAAAVVVALFALSGLPSRMWFTDQRAALAYATGRMSHEAFVGHFSIPTLAYSDREAEEIGLWIRDHSTKDDRVSVRGFQVEVYVFAQRRAPGRFFWTIPFTDPTRLFKREAWLEEDERAVASMPRFVVSSADARGPDAIDRFTKLGYERCHAATKLVVLARPHDDACDR